jgi:uncharacterized protein (TIGR02147 family)
MNEDFFATRDFRQILKREFAQAKLRRPKYTLNAFARDLGIDPPRLNSILKGKYGISLEAATDVAKRLNFSEEETNFFADLVLSQHSRNEIERKNAASRLGKYRKDIRPIENDRLGILSKWFYPATLHLVMQNPSISVNEIADSLRISTEQANEAINVLVRTKEIVSENGVFKAAEGVLSASSPMPNPVVRDFHLQFLDELKKAIIREPVLERKNRSMYVSFDSTRTEEARVWLEKMHTQFVNEFCLSDDVDGVFHFGIYLSRASKAAKQ